MDERQEAPLVSIPGIAGYAERAAALTEGARIAVTVLSHDLDRRIFGTEAFMQAVRKFVLQHSHARFRALIHNPARAIQNGNPLIEFARSMSTFMELREVPADRKGVVEEYVVADGGLLLHRSSPEDLSAHFYPGSPHMARLKLKEFDVMWDCAEPVTELRDLRI